jgi:hypothetical protein
MAMPTSRPFFNWISYNKTTLGHLHDILRKKLFYAKKVTTLPDLTVLITDVNRTNGSKKNVRGKRNERGSKRDGKGGKRGS